MNEQIISQIDKDRFRLLLQTEFEARKKRNQSYSLRAFAGQMDIHASCLSVILKGKRPLTNKLIRRFMNSLTLDAQTIQDLQVNPKKNTKNDTIEYLHMDSIQFLSDWKHDALLELMKCEDYKSDEKWMAKVLDISITEIQIVLERLERLKLISFDNDEWKLQIENSELQIEDITNQALKHYQKMAIDKSRDCLDQIAPEKRYHGTTTMAIHKDKIKEAKEKLRQFRMEFTDNIQNTKNFNSVYQLNIGFYPVLNRGGKDE